MATKPVTPTQQDQSWYQQDPSNTNQYRVIPGAGFYLQDQAKAQDAYQRATAQLGAQRAKQQITSGLGKDWQADPHAMYGTYQQMLQGQGAQLDQNIEQNQQRGFFGPGLGNQGEAAIRYGNAVQSLGFKNQLADWENQYQQGMTDALRAKNAAMLGSLQDAYDQAYSDGDYTTYDPTEDPMPDPTPTTTTRNPRDGGGYEQPRYTPPKVAKKPSYAAVGPGGRRTTTTSKTAVRRRK